MPRGRPRKNIQNEEIQTLINNTLELAKEEVIPQKVFKSREGEWDKKIGDTINYFDPSLSYEITGYKPINFSILSLLFIFLPPNTDNSLKYNHLYRQTRLLNEFVCQHL